MKSRLVSLVGVACLFVCTGVAAAAPIVATTLYDEREPLGAGTTTGISFVWEFTWNLDVTVPGTRVVFAPTKPPGPDATTFWFPEFAIDGTTINFSAIHMRPAGADHVDDVDGIIWFGVDRKLTDFLGDTGGMIPLFKAKNPHPSFHKDRFAVSYNNPPGAQPVTIRFTGVHSAPEPATLVLMAVGACGVWVTRRKRSRSRP